MEESKSRKPSSVEKNDYEIHSVKQYGDMEFHAAYWLRTEYTRQQSHSMGIWLLFNDNHVAMLHKQRSWRDINKRHI